jgi:hypothetical protein
MCRLIRLVENDGHEVAEEVEKKNVWSCALPYSAALR